MPPIGAPLLLSVEDGPSADGTQVVTVCGVFTPGVTGADFQHALTNGFRLKRPERIVPGPSGGTLVSWSIRFAGPRQSDNARVMLAYGVPGLGGPFVNVTYKHKK